MKKKVLNLYAGIGGNRKLWGKEYNITAVELNESIAKAYAENFPTDKVIVANAHDFLLKNYKDFDFIWSSPPCPTHSDIRRCGVHKGNVKAVYPEMTLYQEIIFLRHFAPKKAKWVIENVIPYYEPLIKARKLQRHLFWSNFDIRDYVETDERKHNDISASATVYGFNLKNNNISAKGGKRKVLRNLVNPQLGLHVLKEANLFNKPAEFIAEQAIINF